MSEATPQKRRVRMDLSDGAYMDVTLEAAACPETIEALRALGEAAVAKMRSNDPPTPRRPPP